MLIAASPIILFVAGALTLTNNGKVWFIQPRPGYRGKLFKIIKFRTMTDARDVQGNVLPDGRRLTLAGKIVRKLSLDELPQLLNVIGGQMSLIGPRPLLEEYLPLYNDDQKKRHDVKPGITGWAQVNGRNTLTWKEKFAYDRWYVDHISFWLDLRILALTLVRVFQAKGISSASNETMEKFKGND